MRPWPEAWVRSSQCPKSLLIITWSRKLKFNFYGPLHGTIPFPWYGVYPAIFQGISRTDDLRDFPYPSTVTTIFRRNFQYPQKSIPSTYRTAFSGWYCAPYHISTMNVRSHTAPASWWDAPPSSTRMFVPYSIETTSCQSYRNFSAPYFLSSNLRSSTMCLLRHTPV